jgi:hypothetical protein
VSCGGEREVRGGRAGSLIRQIHRELGDRERVLRGTVHLAPVANVVDRDLLGGGIDLLDDSVVADADAVESLGTGKLDRLSGKRFGLQAIQMFHYTGNGRLGKMAEVLVEGWLECEAIGAHLS